MGGKCLELCDVRTVWGEKYYDVAAQNGIGKRNSQQDSAYIAVNDKSVFAVVCDGMGGMNAGEQASATAVEAFTEYYMKYGDKNADNSWMKGAVEAVDDIVYQMIDSNGKKLGAGTTLVSVVLNENHLSWVSVGDSRIYIFRKKEVVQITNDHNYFMKLNQDLQAGVITQDCYKSEAGKGEALISFLGMGGLMLVDINEDTFPLEREDTILLCTDGVYRSIPDEDLGRIMEQCEDMKQAAVWIEEYIKETNKKYQDNYTYVLIRVKGKET